jgi:hypothetical protein
MRLPKWIKDYAAHVTHSAATTVTVAAAVGVWTSLKIFATVTQLGLPIAIAGGLIAAAVLIMAWNALREIDESHRRRSLAHRSPTEIERQISQWFYAFKYQIKDAKTADTDFNMLVTNEQEMKFNILQPKDSPFVVIATKTIIPRNDDLYKIVKREASTFQFDVGIALAQLGVEYSMTEPEQGLEVVLQRPIVFDETVTDLGFMRELMPVHRGLSIFKFSAGRALTVAGFKGVPQLPPASKRDP